ncbi:MAG: OmpP1/FadL family transporter [Gemmatimonadota bacterium]
MRTRLALLALSCLVGLPTPARSQALLRTGVSARALGMGGAAVATARDAGAAYHNPAGIVELTGTHVQVTGFASADAGRLRVFGDREYDEEDGLRLDGSLFVTHQVAQGVTAGVSVTEPWFLDIDWERPTSFAGRFRASEAQLRTLSVSPVVAFGPLGRWSLAAGIEAVHSDLNLQRFENDPALSALGGGEPISLARTTIESDATGVGWTASAAFRPEPRITLAGGYHSEIEIVYNGFADFLIIAPETLQDVVLPDGETTVRNLLDDRFTDRPVRIPLVLPRRGVAGIAVRPFEQFELAIDAGWTDRGAVDSLAVLYADSVLDDSTPWPLRGGWDIHIGSELQLRNGMRVRLGYAWEESRGPAAAVTPFAPASGADAISGGVGFLWEGMTFDLGYRITFYDDAEGVAFPHNTEAADGVYESLEHRLAIGVSRTL